MTRRTFIVPSIADCVFILALLIVTLVWARPALNTDGDAGRHIRVGETILQRGGLFYEDLFSHTMAGERFVPYEWGSETLTALAHRAGGLPGVVILHGLVVAVAWFLLALFLRRRGVDPLLAFLVSVGAAAASAFHWLARPHVFSFIGAILTLWLLETEGRKDGKTEGAPGDDFRPSVLPSFRPLLATLLLFVAWANLHGGFLFGLVLIGMYLVGDALEILLGEHREAWRRRLTRHALMFIAAIAGAAINPSGFALFAHVTGYLGKTYLVNMTNEYMSPDFHLWFGRAFLVVLLALLLGILLSRRRPSWPVMVVFLGTLAFALHSARNIPLFCLTALPLLAVHLDAEWRELRWRPLDRIRAGIATGDGQARAGGWMVGFAALFLVLLAGSGRLAGVPVVVADYDPKIFPVEAVRRAREAGLEGRIFNQFIWGGYILYAWPEQRVFIDGQTDFYGETLTREYGQVASTSDGWSDRLRARRIDILIMPTSSQLVSRLALGNSWNIWHQDSTAIILRRSDGTD
jgi:hypothetical protein